MRAHSVPRPLITSQLGLDYSDLRDYLAAGDVRKADDETRALLIKMAGQGAVQRGWVYFTGNYLLSIQGRAVEVGAAHLVASRGWGPVNSLFPLGRGSGWGTPVQPPADMCVHDKHEIELFGAAHMKARQARLAKGSVHQSMMSQTAQRPARVQPNPCCVLCCVVLCFVGCRGAHHPLS